MASTPVSKPAVSRAVTGLRGPRIVYLAIVVFAAMCGIGFGVGGYADQPEQAVRLAIRETARTTLLLFAVVFCAASLRRRWKSDLTRYLIQNRRYLGLAAAVSHGYHLLFILILYAMGVAGDTPAATVIGGSWGFVMLAAMAATSNDASQRALRKNWRRLHLLGSWTVWIIFAVSYFPMAFANPIAGAASVALMAALLLRVWPQRSSAIATR